MLKILLIDDDKNEHALVSAYLETQYDNAHELVTVFTLADALVALSKIKFDIILLDNRLPPYRSYAQTLPAITPYLDRTKLYLISASVEDIHPEGKDTNFIDNVFDKFELRNIILSGRFG